MKNPIYEIKNLTYKYKESNIISIKKFDIHRSACYLINGNMASGKTLILEILAKENNRYKGDVLYENKLLSSTSSKLYNSEVRFVKQSIKQPYFKNVSAYIASVIGKSDSKDKSINDIIKKMDFKYIANHKMRDLTPSQLRWVDLAANIASFPKVLFIDELELHLSSSKIKNLCKILYRKVNYEGITIIATTQNKDYFHSLPSVNININHGRITSVRSKK